MRLIITRHGQTEENKEGRLQGHTDGTLTAEGIQQAKKLAVRLKDEELDTVYCSDLGRAKNTAAEIMKFHESVPVTYDERIREGHWGTFQQKTWVEVWGKHEHIDRGLYPDVAEQRDSMIARAQAFFDDICSKHMRDTVLVVAHAEINNALYTVIKQKDAEFMKGTPRAPNTGVTILDIKEDRSHHIHVHANDDHLR